MLFRSSGLTSGAAAEAGLQISAEATESTWDGLLEAVRAAVGRAD